MSKTLFFCIFHPYYQDDKLSILSKIKILNIKCKFSLRRYLSFTLLVLLFFSCIPSEHWKKNVFRYNEPGGISSLDPIYASNLENIWVISQLFNGLVSFDDSLNIQPSIAKKWEISEDGKIYTFYIRDSVFFHPNKDVFGEKLTRKVKSSDIVFSLLRLFDEKNASPGRYIFNFIDIHKDPKHLGIEPVNDSIVRIHLKAPFAPFLAILTMPYCYIVPREAVEYYKADFGRNPIGTGPFMFKIWKEKTKLVLTKNPLYFERDSNKKQLPYIDAISVNFIKERHTELFSLQKNEIDMISAPPIDVLIKILNSNNHLKQPFEKNYYVQRLLYLKTDYIGFLLDSSDNPINNKNIRKAIFHAINVPEIIKYVRMGIGIPANGSFLPPPLLEKKWNIQQYDPALAKMYLTQAGFPHGIRIPDKLYITKHFEDFAISLQKNLLNVGIHIEIEVLDEVTFRQMVAHQYARIFKKSWIADYPDAESFLSIFYSKNSSPNGPNYTHFNNHTFDSLYLKALSTPDLASRQIIYQKLNEIIFEELPVIPLYHDEIIRIIHKRVKNLPLNQMNALSLKNVIIEVD